MDKPKCLNCRVTEGAYIYCKHLSEAIDDDRFDETGETTTCKYWKTNKYEFREFNIPAHMLEVIERYVEHGTIPGDFIQAVICNNLHDALSLADDDSLRNILAYVGYFYNEAPGACWGSKKKMKEWHESKVR